MEPGARNPRISTFATAALSLLVVGSALAVGTVHITVLFCVSAFATLSLFAVVWVDRPNVRHVASPTLVLLALSAWCAVQAIPLPLTFLSIIAPHNADIWARALHPFREPAPLFGSISLDPGASVVEALKWMTYAWTFALAQWVGQRRTSATGTKIAFGSAVAVALVTVGHGLAGATSLFGVYTPELASPRWGIPPILNPNNLSSYLNFGAFCGLGMLISRRRTGERWALTTIAVGAGIAIVVAVSVLAASRGGVLGLAVGMLGLAVIRLFRAGKTQTRAGAPTSKRSRGRVRAVVPILLAIGGGLLLAIVASSEATWIELRERNTEKLRILTWSLPLIENHPWFGVGRGAFESVFPAYRRLGGHVVFAHPENFVVQWIAEWGIPVAATALFSFGWLFWRTRRSIFRTSTGVAALVGVVVMLLQNMVDLALEIPGIAIVLWMVLGSLWEAPDGSISHEPSTSPSRFRRLEQQIADFANRNAPHGVATVGALLLVLAVSFGSHSAANDRAESHSNYENGRFGDLAAYRAFRSYLRDVVLRHPAEPYFSLLGALAATRTRGTDALPWIAQALERDEMNGRAHLILAEVLATRGATDQGIMELRFAAEREPDLAALIGQTAFRLTSSQEKLEAAVPNGSPGAVTLVGIAQATQGEETRQLRLNLLEKAIARDPTYTTARVARAYEVLGAVVRSSGPCTVDDKARCLAAIRGDAAAIRLMDVASCHPTMLEAAVLDAEDKTLDAANLLEQTCGACREKTACSSRRLQLAARVHEGGALAAAVRTYLADACSHESTCVQAHLLVGEVFAGRGEWTTSADHFSLAAEQGRTADAWLRVADASLRARDPGRATRALAKAKRDGGRDIQALEQRIAQMERDILRDEVNRSPASPTRP